VLVNAGIVHKHARNGTDLDTGARIEGVIRRRMARILFFFEHQGIHNIVLGSFRTGVLHNDVSMIVEIWSDLLAEQGACFMRSFDRVIFGIHRQTNSGKIQGRV